MLIIGNIVLRNRNEYNVDKILNNNNIRIYGSQEKLVDKEKTGEKAKTK